MSYEHPAATPQIEELEAQRRNFADQIRGVCADYGLYGNVILHRPSPIPGSHCNKLYLIASRDPDIVNGKTPFDPEYYLRRNNRSDRLVYTDIFVYDLGAENNRLDAMEKLLEYCKYTEFLTTLYARYNLASPEKLRRFEIRQLMDARDKQRRVQMDGIWKQSTEALNEFFSKEMKKGLQKEWLDFFRSDKYPDDAGPFKKLRAFRHRHDPEVSLEQLMACNGHIQTLEMQEHEYRRFADFMRNAYPDVSYAVSKKIVIDNGIYDLPHDLEQEYGKRVTGEEYNKILERNFARDGGASIQNLRPAYFEIRKVSFATVDEPYIASAFNDATLRYAHRDELTTIKGRGGDLQLHSIPKEDFMSFVSLAKANALPFYIDNLGQFETPSLEYVSVIYSSRDEHILFGVLDRIVNEKVDNSHLVPEDERPLLKDVLTQAHQLQASEKTNNVNRQNKHERT